MTFPHTASLSRTVKQGTKYTYGDNGSTECFLQPLNNDDSKIVGMTFGKGSYCYIPLAADVAAGDHMTINGTTFSVRGVAEHNYSSLAHKRVLLEEL